MYPCRDCIHSKQGHPSWAMHYRTCEHPSVQNNEKGLSILRVSLNANLEELIEEGWFIFPFNYDPTWINDCKAQEPRRD